MKSYFSVKTYLLTLIVGGSMALGACTEDESPDPKVDDNPIDTTTVDAGDKDDPEEIIDANEISNSLMLENASVNNGRIPAPSKLADLKFDKDTIFFVEGFKNRIRILYPPTSGFAASGLSTYIQVEGADEYYDLKLVEEESSDTVGVFYMEFDTDGWEPPFSFNIKIAPHDESGVPIDTATTPVVIEEEGNPLCSPWTGIQWNWLYTIIDGEIETAPGFGRTTETHVTGCCSDDGESVDCIEHFIPEEEWKKIQGISAYSIEYEALSFTANGEISGGLQEFIQNLNPSPEKTDFCSGSLGYITHTTDHLFWGDYTYDPSSGRIQFSNLESRAQEVDLGDLGTYTVYDKYFINPNFLYEIISCHFLMETGSVEGKSIIRLFERETSPEDWID